MNKVPNLTRQEAELFYYFIRHKEFRDSSNRMHIEASGIHFLYLISIVLLVGAVLLLLSSGISSTLIILSVAFLLVTISGFLYDYHHETLECYLLKNVKQANIEKYIKRCFPDRNKGSGSDI
jgi:hypothetical protein